MKTSIGYLALVATAAAVSACNPPSQAATGEKAALAPLSEPASAAPPSPGAPPTTALLSITFWTAASYDDLNCFYATSAPIGGITYYGGGTGGWEQLTSSEPEQDASGKWSSVSGTGYYAPVGTWTYVFARDLDLHIKGQSDESQFVPVPGETGRAVPLEVRDDSGAPFANIFDLVVLNGAACL